jgi:hypothetical protein
MTKISKKLFVNYLTLIDPKIKKEFLDSIHDKSLYKIRNGEELTKDHPKYGLIKIINSFQDGKNREGLQNIENPQEFFKEKGQHYCAGYLSRFGYVISAHETDDFFVIELTKKFRRLTEKKYFEAAKEVWNKNFI